MKTVSSLKNPAVQAARALRDARERARQGAFLLDGEHMVGEALAACPDRVSALFVDEARLEAYAALTALVPQTACYAVPSHVLAAISQVKTPQGVAAVCAMPPSPAPEEMGNRLILLENVQDPGNVGTVIRTADAAGAHGVIIPKRRSAGLTAVVAKTSAGAVSHLPVARVANLPSLLKQLKKEGLWIFGAAADGPVSLYEADLKGPAAIVIGSEGSGMSRLVAETCDVLVRIPMKGKLNSLNASAAAAILLYEAVRQRR